MRYTFFFALVLLLLNFGTGYSQCRKFAKEECKPKLEGYTHDGNYNGVVLNLGEEVELHKAFFSDQKYRIVVSQEDHLPPVHLKIMNSELEVIYDNQKHNFIDTYDFELKEAANLIISVKLPDEKINKEYPRNGCVAILFGMKL
jgi:hypothetical protein